MSFTVEDFRTRTVMPSGDVDELEARDPGFLAARLVRELSWIHSVLKKRYAVPFAEPIPEIVLGWLTDLVTHAAYQRRGYNPGSAQDGEFKEAAERARAEIKEAADSDKGLFDLPLREDGPSASGISKGGPLGYAEQSPYTWTDRQAEVARGE